MHNGLEGLTWFMGTGLAVLALVLALALGWGGVAVWRAWRGLGGKRPRALPPHRVPWGDEAVYETTLQKLHAEVRQAVADRDQETLEVISEGSALELFRSRFGCEDPREVLQGSVRQSVSGERLVVTLVVTRWARGWRRFYEEWTVERRGQGWFIVSARPTKL